MIVEIQTFIQLFKIFIRKGYTNAKRLPPPTSALSVEFPATVTTISSSCYLCGIYDPETGIVLQKCTKEFQGDLRETISLIDASNALLKTNNTFRGCLTIYSGSGNIFI